MTKDIILCKCQRQPVKSEVVKGKAFGRKYFCEVTGIQLRKNIIHAKAKVDLPDPDDTRDGSEVECPDDLERELEDYKKRQGGDE